MNVSICPVRVLSPTQCAAFEGRMETGREAGDKGPPQVWGAPSFRDRFHAIVLDPGAEPIGALHLGGPLDATQVGWWLDPGFRGRGLASRMIEALADYLKHNGVTKLGHIKIDDLCYKRSEHLRDKLCRLIECCNRGRVFEESLTHGLTLNDGNSDEHARDGKTIGFGESERDGLASTASLDLASGLSYSLVGSSPQGEDDTERACSILMQRLRLVDGGFQTITKGVEPADRVLVNADPQKTLEVQVVRSVVLKEFWGELSATGSVTRVVAVREAAYSLRRAIEHKEQHLVPPVRAGLVLVLDATRVSGLAFHDVMRRVPKIAQTSWAMTLGFRAIWLVGPNTDLTWRLDSQG